jgi:membrane associated rhomboid family serine protease
VNDYDASLQNGAPVTVALLALIVAAGIAGLSVAPRLVAAGLLRPWQVARGQRRWTLLTSGFLHASYGHLLFNALTLWSFGLGTVYRRRNDPDYASLGASGAILAVLFASILYFPLQSIFMMFLPVPIPAWLFALLYLAYSVYASRFAQDRINHDAHLGGALAGILFVLVSDPPALRRAFSLLF